MIWHSKTPPIFVWDGDIWIRESDNFYWIACIKTKEWIGVSRDSTKDNLFDRIPFSPKTKIMKKSSKEVEME